MVQHFVSWRDDAPPEYQTDTFLKDRVPIIVTSRYGQNQDIGTSDEEVIEDNDSWSRERDFSALRYVTIAIATHISFVAENLSI